MNIHQLQPPPLSLSPASTPLPALEAITANNNRVVQGHLVYVVSSGPAWATRELVLKIILYKKM